MIKNKLSELMGREKLKMSEVQRMTGLSESTIRRLYHNTASNISLDTLNKLCKALDCKLSDIFEYVPDEEP